MLIDMHIHTSGISFCSAVPPENLIEICSADKLGGIVLTNHCKSAYINIPYKQWRIKYVDEFRYTEELGQKAGLKVFFGIEVTPDCMKQNDFVIYGLTPENIATSEELPRYTLPQLSEYAHSNGALILHAHPFRNTVPVEPEYIDGVEINCHPLYGTNEKKRVTEFADKYDLRITCGSDYHGDTYKAHCGVVVPDDIDNDSEFFDYIYKTKRPELVIHDIVPGIIH